MKNEYGKNEKMNLMAKVGEGGKDVSQIDQIAMQALADK